LNLDIDKQVWIMSDLITIAQKFISLGKVVKVQELGEGNINQTFLVVVKAGLQDYFILQKINTQVFTNPELIMDNLQVLTNHAQNKLANLALEPNYCWQIPQVLVTSNQKHHYLDQNNGFWRAISFVESAKSYNTIQNKQHAQEIGYGLGIFHHLISDINITKLVDTLPNFHLTPTYLKQYKLALANSTQVQNTETIYCQQFIEARVSIVDILERAKAQGILPVRPIHGDPKINNIMIDTITQKTTAMVDLDTVKPGLIHYDLGDCLRSGCNILGEETIKWKQVNFDLDLARSILQGYFKIANNFITKPELDYIYDSVRLISFELGLRFFTDYLHHNIYFKNTYPEHNLKRALVQFQLTKSIEFQETLVKNLIQNFRDRFF
jgi:Ser/Thr protein kinase RdoA (MazF antagonist)